MSPFLLIMIFPLTFHGILFVRGQDNSGYLEHIDGYNETAFGNRVFYISTETQTWSNAKTTCENLGGRLAVLNNRTALEHVRTFLKALPRDEERKFWIGLQWFLFKQSYQWLSGETHEHDGNPDWQGGDDDSDGNYVAMVSPGFLFNNDEDSKQYYFMCEKDIPRPETSTPKAVTSSTTAEVASSTTEEVTSTETDAAGTSSTIPVSSTSTMATTREEAFGNTNSPQGTENPVSYITEIVVPCIVVVACIVVATLLACYFTKKRLQTRSMKDAELVSMTRQGLPGTEMRFDNSTYGEQRPLSTDENLGSVYTNTHGLEATGGMAAPTGGPLQERGERDGSSVPDAETYDHAFQSRPVARDATGNIYGHLQDANATETETETYDHAFNTKTTNLQSGGGSDCYGHLTLEGKTDSDDPYDSTAQTRSREATVDCNAYDHMPVENSGVTSPDSSDPTEPVYINK